MKYLSLLLILLALCFVVTKNHENEITRVSSGFESKAEAVTVLAKVYMMHGHTLINHQPYMTNIDALGVMLPSMMASDMGSIAERYAASWRDTGGFTFGRFTRLVAIPVDPSECELARDTVNDIKSAVEAVSKMPIGSVKCLRMVYKRDGVALMYDQIRYFLFTKAVVFAEDAKINEKSLKKSAHEM